jgi:hypothetical protein
MATTYINRTTQNVKLVGAALLCATALALAAEAQSVSTTTCGWVDPTPGGLAWQHLPAVYVCKTITSEAPAPVALVAPSTRFATPEEQQEDNLRKTEQRLRHWNPREVSLCPLPNRMTEDGCQPHPYRPHWLATH